MKTAAYTPPYKLNEQILSLVAEICETATAILIMDVNPLRFRLTRSGAF